MSGRGMLAGLLIFILAGVFSWADAKHLYASTAQVQTPSGSKGPTTKGKSTDSAKVAQQTPPAFDDQLPRTKTCYTSLTPRVSCTSEVSHQVGDSCTCRDGDRILRGRYLKPGKLQPQ
jgi:hypothetical protein